MLFRDESAGLVMLQIESLEFSYSSSVLKGLSFRVVEGELLAVVGPNGSGKSTLLKIIAGILPPRSGRVLIDDIDLRGLSRRSAARLIGYVPQEMDARFPITAIEFVLQGRFAHGNLIGFESDEDRREATRAMELTETLQYAGKFLNEVSGGERQRVVLARALASKPRVLVLDEPVANLDISHQVKILDVVKELATRGGLNAVLVTHELNLAAEYADRVLMLKGGAMAACGAPREVFTEERLRDVFDTDLMVDVNPISGAPRITVKATRKEAETVSFRTR